MKKRMIILIFIIFSIIFPQKVLSYDGEVDTNIKDKEKLVEEQIKNLNLEELQNIIKDIDSSNKYLPKIDFKQTLNSLLKGENFLDANELINGFVKILFSEIMLNSSLLAKLIILSIICAILTNLQSTFEKETVGELSYYICYLIIIAISLKSFAMAMEVGKKAVEEMVIFMQALLPTLITLLIAVGGLSSSALFHPLILGVISAISTFMKDIVFPLIFISAVIGIISNLSNKVQISKLSSLLRQTTIVIIGFLLTVFIGIMSLQGVTTAKIDGITIRTAKFAVDKFVPIVGGFLSDAVDTVIGYSVLLKNAVGVIGLIALFAVCTIPLIKIISLIFIYKIASVIIEPISENRILNCLSEISKALIIVFATVASVGIMFFIAISIIIAAGNTTFMLR